MQNQREQGEERWEQGDEMWEQGDKRWEQGDGTPLSTPTSLNGPPFTPFHTKTKTVRVGTKPAVLHEKGSSTRFAFCFDSVCNPFRE